MSQSEAGKGDGYRKVDQKTYGDNYDRIFGKKKPVSDTKVKEVMDRRSEAIDDVLKYLKDK